MLKFSSVIIAAMVVFMTSLLLLQGGANAQNTTAAPNATSSNATTANTTAAPANTSAAPANTTAAPVNTTAAPPTTTTAMPKVIITCPNTLYSDQNMSCFVSISQAVTTNLTVTSWYSNNHPMVITPTSITFYNTSGTYGFIHLATDKYISSPSVAMWDWSLSGADASSYQLNTTYTEVAIRPRISVGVYVAGTNNVAVPENIENGTALHLTVKIYDVVPDSGYIMVTPNFNAGNNGQFTPYSVTFQGSTLTQNITFYPTLPTSKATAFEWFVEGMSREAFNYTYIWGCSNPALYNIVVPATTTTTTLAPTTTTTVENTTTVAAATTVVATTTLESTTAAPANTTTVAAGTTVAPTPNTTTTAAPQQQGTTEAPVVATSTTVAPTPNTTSAATTTVAATTVAGATTTSAVPPPPPTTTAAPTTTTTLAPGQTTTTEAPLTINPSSPPPGWLVIKRKNNTPLTNTEKTNIKNRLAAYLNYPASQITVGNVDASTGEVLILLEAPAGGSANTTEVDNAIAAAQTLTTAELDILGAASVSEGTPAPPTTAPSDDDDKMPLIIGCAVGGFVLVVIILAIIKAKSSAGTGAAMASAGAEASSTAHLNRMENEMAQHHQHQQQQARGNNGRFIDSEL